MKLVVSDTAMSLENLLPLDITKTGKSDPNWTSVVGSVFTSVPTTNTHEMPIGFMTLKPIA